MCRAKTVAFCVSVMAASILVTGCGMSPAFVPPDLPADLQLLVDDSAARTIPSTEQADPKATAVQSAADLSGCWGRAYEPVENDVSSGDALFSGQTHVVAQMFEVWHFDADTQSVRYEMLLRDNLTGVSTLQIMSGTFTLPTSGALTIQFTKFETNNWATGEIEEVPETQFLASTLAVEQSGGRLYFLDAGTTVATSDPNDIWIVQRYTCPE